MVAAVEHRFGRVNRLPPTIEWLTDHRSPRGRSVTAGACAFGRTRGSGYVLTDTRHFAREIGLEPRTTPLKSPPSNGPRPACAGRAGGDGSSARRSMAAAFVRTLKRDHGRVSPVPDAVTVLRQLPGWPAHHNEVHPHKALGYRSPREFLATRSNQETLSGRSGATTEPLDPVAVGVDPRWAGHGRFVTLWRDGRPRAHAPDMLAEAMAGVAPIRHDPSASGRSVLAEAAAHWQPSAWHAGQTVEQREGMWEFVRLPRRDPGGGGPATGICDHASPSRAARPRACGNG